MHTIAITRDEKNLQYNLFFDKLFFFSSKKNSVKFFQDEDFMKRQIKEFIKINKITCIWLFIWINPCFVSIS